LIVDDDRTVRGLLERVLSGAGYRVLVASDGKDALGQIAGEKGPIDLLLSDVVMPEMNGPDLFARLRERDPGLKAIFISGYAEDVMARDADLWEGLPLVRKPFRLHDVAVKVREVLDAI
jgi:DNA-binding NtrC family response regulator